MNKLICAATLTLLTCICSSNASAEMDRPITTFKDSYITFSYPTKSYKQIDQYVDGNNDDKMRFYNLVRRDGDISDIITICEASLNVCASGKSQISPYWIDGETHQLSLYDTTSSVTHNKTKNGDFYKAFPLCPATDETGKSDGFGADCYLVVKSDGRNTISLTYWLGSNAIACTRESRLDALRRANEILESIVAPL